MNWDFPQLIGVCSRTAFSEKGGFKLGDVEQYLPLSLVVFAGVGVATVDYDSGRNVCLLQQDYGKCNMLGCVVRPLGASPQDHVAAIVAACFGDNYFAVSVDAHEEMRACGSFDRINGGAEVAVHGILEADRH